MSRQQTPQTTLADEATTPAANAGTAQPGRQLGRYVLEALIGRGGMGEVHRARQLAPVQRTVALKLLQQRLKGTLAEALFEVESQALARMRHPSIAQVFDAGSLDGQPYLAMEWVEGRTLADWLVQERPDRRQRLALLAEVARGAHHAHVNGILHRDLKPDNILVTSEQGRVQPKIVDFGVAMSWMLERGQGRQRPERVGTPDYMSPEQREGRLDLDPRSDVYALGVMLAQMLVVTDGEDLPSLSSHGYEALLGQLEPEVGAEDEVWRRRLHELPADLRWLLRRALAEDRARRYESALELAQELERFLARQPLLAVPPSRGYRLRKFLDRNRLPMLMAGFALGALLVGLAATLYGLEQARTERARAMTAAEQAALEARRSQRVSEFLQSILAAVDPNEARELDKTLLRKVLDAAARRAATELADDPQVLGSIESVIGRSYRGLGEAALALPLLQAARQRGALADAAAMRVLSMTLDDLGRTEEATALLQDYRAALLAAPQIDEGEVLRVEAELVEYGLRQAEHGSALEAGLDLLPRLQAAVGPDDTAVLLLMNSVARGLARDGRADESAALLEDVVQRRTRLQGADHPSTLRDRGALVIAKLEGKRPNEALLLVDQQIPLSERMYGVEHPATLALHSLRGSALKALGREQEAVAAFRTAYDGYAAKFGAEHPHVIGTGYNVASTLVAAGDAAAAEDWLAELLPRAERVFGADHPLYFDIRVALAGSQLAQGQAGPGEAALLALDAEARQRFGAQPRADDVRRLLRQHYERSGDAAAAARYAD